MPRVRNPSALRSLRTDRAPLQRSPAAAVVLSLVLAAAGTLGGCEYTYDDGRIRPDAAQVDGTQEPGPAFTRNPPQNEPVDEAGVQDWADRTLPERSQPTVDAEAGLLVAGEVRAAVTGPLEAGTYALALACRSQRRVTFTVRSDELTLVELGLRCGINRENVIYISAGTILDIRVEARTAANYAYRLRRL